MISPLKQINNEINNFGKKLEKKTSLLFLRFDLRKDT